MLLCVLIRKRKILKGMWAACPGYIFISQPRLIQSISEMILAGVPGQAEAPAKHESDKLVFPRILSRLTNNPPHAHHSPAHMWSLQHQCPPSSCRAHFPLWEVWPSLTQWAQTLGKHLSSPLGQKTRDLSARRSGYSLPRGGGQMSPLPRKANAVKFSASFSWHWLEAFSASDPRLLERDAPRVSPLKLQWHFPFP